MKWNISVIKRKEIKKYFGSTGEGTWNRPIINFLVVLENILNLLLKQVIALYKAIFLLISSKMLNVN